MRMHLTAIAVLALFPAVSCALTTAPSSADVESADFARLVLHRGPAEAASEIGLSRTHKSAALLHEKQVVGTLVANYGTSGAIRSLTLSTTSSACLPLPHVTSALYATSPGVDNSGYPFHFPLVKGSLDASDDGRCVKSAIFNSVEGKTSVSDVQPSPLTFATVVAHLTGAEKGGLDDIGRDGMKGRRVLFADGYMADWVNLLRGPGAHPSWTADAVLSAEPCLPIDQIAASFHARQVMAPSGAFVYERLRGAGAATTHPHPENSQCVGRIQAVAPST